MKDRSLFTARPKASFDSRSSGIASPPPRSWRLGLDVRLHCTAALQCLTAKCRAFLLFISLLQARRESSGRIYSANRCDPIRPISIHLSPWGNGSGNGSGISSLFVPGLVWIEIFCGDPPTPTATRDNPTGPQVQPLVLHLNIRCVCEFDNSNHNRSLLFPSNTRSPHSAPPKTIPSVHPMVFCE